VIRLLIKDNKGFWGQICWQKYLEAHPCKRGVWADPWGLGKDLGGFPKRLESCVKLGLI